MGRSQAVAGQTTGRCATTDERSVPLHRRRVECDEGVGSATDRLEGDAGNRWSTANRSNVGLTAQLQLAALELQRTASKGLAKSGREMTVRAETGREGDIDDALAAEVDLQ